MYNIYSQPTEKLIDKTELFRTRCRRWGDQARESRSNEDAATAAGAGGVTAAAANWPPR